ncbi:PfkB family carbohydrate kinase [Pelagibacterales bacterium]|nr:PfkB family carbohydrate kinase [Pelagibacterales bacterium]
MCIGDIVLDHYINGKIERMSPEAPVPILVMKGQKYEVGGAGNVARNISNMGSKTTFIGLTGKDQSSITVKKLLKKNKRIKNISVSVPNFETPIKTRFINEEGHLSHLRKPGIGMLELAESKWAIDRSKSFLIGNKNSDIECAKNFLIRGHSFKKDNLLNFIKLS